MPLTRPSKRCDECESEHFADASPMEGLCAACAHALYGYPACAHLFDEGRCQRCGWDGSRSDYLRALEAQAPALDEEP